MATLNLSTNGPSISKSYQSIVTSPPPSGNAAQSPTYGQWAVYSVSAPLVNVFQQGAGGKESVLKVQSTGGQYTRQLPIDRRRADTACPEGELIDLIDEFSDGRVQFAFVKVKDPNTSLPKYVLVGWCGEGVPERTKGYFTSYLATVSKTLHVSIGLNECKLSCNVSERLFRGIMYKSPLVPIAISLRKASFRKCQMHPAPSTQVDPPLPLQVGPRLLSSRNLLLRRRAVAEGLVASIHWLVLEED